MNAAAFNPKPTVITTSSLPSPSQQTSALQRSVLRVLLYYDLFQYPLTAGEILSHSDEHPCDIQSVTQTLDELVSERIIFSQQSLYSVRNAPELFERRKAGNRHAEEVMAKARRRSDLIAAFPYVRGVYISGSLSKGYFDSTTDMDFFIITEPNRLWICRTLLILYKKIFLLNSKKYFCVNYFIDTGQLRIPDQNIFTATEIATLLPMYNYELYRRFYDENLWVRAFFPNSEPRRLNGSHMNSSPVIKSIAERMLNGALGEWLDQLFFRTTLNHWKKKFGSQPHHEFELNMRSRRSVSKHHPQGFQFQVLKAFKERVKEFEKQHGIPLRLPAPDNA